MNDTFSSCPFLSYFSVGEQFLRSTAPGLGIKKVTKTHNTTNPQRPTLWPPSGEERQNYEKVLQLILVSRQRFLTLVFFTETQLLKALRAHQGGGLMGIRAPGLAFAAVKIPEFA